MAAPKFSAISSKGVIATDNVFKCLTTPGVTTDVTVMIGLRVGIGSTLEMQTTALHFDGGVYTGKTDAGWTTVPSLE